MNSKKTFVISTRDMFEKMKLEFEDFKNDTQSSRHAINFVLTVHHLKEWVWKSYLQDNAELRNNVSPLSQDKNSYYSFLNSECKEIKLIHELANNIKHFYSQGNEIQETTNNNKPWEEITCTWENWRIPWDYDGLIIITKDNHWVSVLDIFQKVHDYWANCFNTSLKNFT